MLPSSRHHAVTPRQTPSSIHDQIEREIFDEELHVVLQALLIERMQHARGRCGRLRRRRAVGWGLLAEFRHVAAERALVDLAVIGAAERHAEMLELVHRGDRLAAHVFDRVLVAEPVRPLDGVVHVPAPVVFAHIAERRADAALRGDGVAARREYLGDAGGLQAGRTHAEGCAQPGAAGADHHHVIGMIDNVVSARRGQSDGVHRCPFRL